MTSLTVGLDERLAERLNDEAKRRGLPAEELARLAVADYLGSETAPSKIEFIGMGSSKELRSDRADELLEEGFGR